MWSILNYSTVLSGTAGGVTRLVMRTGSAERKFSQEAGVPGVLRPLTGRTSAGCQPPVSRVQCAVSRVTCPASTRHQTSDRGSWSLTHLDGCLSKIGFRFVFGCKSFNKICLKYGLHDFGQCRLYMDFMVYKIY